MTIEKRLSNLENLVNALSKKIDRNSFYTEADISGNRQSISNVTPFISTKTAYIDDTECIFTEVPTGNMTVYCSVPHTVERDGDRVAVKFEPLEEVIEVTISII